MLQNKIICPKCRTRSLRKSHGINPRGEMFCDKDHEYMTIWELVHIWGYDAGDFVNQNNFSLLPKSQKSIDLLVGGLIWNPNPIYPIDTLSMFEGEPLWNSNQEREQSYAMVHRMFDGIPEYDDYQDLKNTQESALDRGIQ